MKKLFAIIEREWRAYFLSPLAYVIMAAFLLVNGYIFYIIVNYLNAPGTSKGQALPYLFTNTFFWFFTLFVVPIISMRLFAEERKAGTLEMLLTSPVSEGTVVLGKFFGAVGFYLSLWLPTLVYVGILRAQTPVDPGPVAASYMAITLLGCYFLSVGVFASTLTKNQIIAAILTFAMLIVIFSAGLLQNLSAEPQWREQLGYFNLWEHMEEFTKGIVDTRRIVYYVSATLFFLFLTTVSVSTKKEAP